MGQQFADAAGRLRRQPLEHVADVGIGLEPIELGRVDQAHDGGGALAGAQRSSEEPVLPPNRDWADAVLHPVVVDRQIAVIQEARQRVPAVEAVVDRPGSRCCRIHWCSASATCRDRRRRASSLTWLSLSATTLSTS